MTRKMVKIMKKEIVRSDAAPAAAGPYSQAVKFSNIIYLSGQIPLDPENNEIVSGGIEIQTERVLLNIKLILAAAGSCLDNVLKTTIYLSDMDDFVIVNKVYEKYFGDNSPARSTIEAARLPKGAKIEIDVVAFAG